MPGSEPKTAPARTRARPAAELEGLPRRPAILRSIPPTTRRRKRPSLKQSESAAISDIAADSDCFSDGRLRRLVVGGMDLSIAGRRGKPSSSAAGRARVLAGAVFGSEPGMLARFYLWRRKAA